MVLTRKHNTKKRHKRVRAKIHGTANIPRLSVYVSNKHFYAQIINDDDGKTIASSSDKIVSGSSELSRKDLVRAVGRDIAEKAIASKGTKKVVFDRGGRKYAGNVKSIADAAREAGLLF